MRFGLQCAALVVLFVAVPCSCQTAPDIQTGIKPYASLHGGDIDSVDLQTGNVMLHVPLISFPQKGALSLDFWIRLNSVNWELKPYQYLGSQDGDCPSGQCGEHGIDPSWHFKGNGVDIAWNGDFVMLPGNTEINDQNPVPIPDAVTDPTGAVHTLASTPFGSGQFSELAVDGSGFSLLSNVGFGAQNGDSFSIEDRNGITYSYVASSSNTQTTTVTDKNGNSISRFQPVYPSGQDNGWIDSVGRVIPGGANTHVQDPIATTPGRAKPYTVQFIPGALMPDTTGCPSGTSQARSWQVPAYGGTATYLFCITSIPLHTNFQYWYYKHFGTTRYTAPEYDGSASLLTAIVLPNGQMWQFTYQPNSYGHLTQVKLPTGGTISYTWSDAADEILTVGVQHVITRTVNANDGTGDHTWTYSGFQSSMVSVVGPAPDSNETQHDFSPFGISFAETATRWYQGAASAGQLLKSTSTIYQDYSDAGLLTSIPVPISRITTLPGAGTSSESITNSSSAASIGPDNFTIPVAEEKSISFLDFGASVPDHTVTKTFAWENDSAYSWAPDLVSSVVTTAGTAQIARTDYTYDESTYSPGGKLGHLTTQTNWLSAGGSPVTHTGWNSSGMKSYTIDASGNANSNGHTTDYTYNQCNNSLVSDAYNALGHHTTATYDCNSGLVTSITEPNSNSTSYNYDTMGRILSASFPDGGSTTFTYDDPGLHVTRTIDQYPNPSVQYKASFDGLGREIKHELVSDPQGTISVETTYDNNGHVFTVTNPHRSGSATTDGTTTHYTDALGQLIAEVEPDSTVKMWCYNGIASSEYSGNCPANVTGASSMTWITSTDEAANVWTRSKDGLGRLRQVVEPGSLVTNYQYSPLGDLTHVSQIGTTGETQRNRSFTYDELSRLLTSSNPETGSICYGSLSGGTCTGGYDANGNLLHKTDARGVRMDYSYDALNRLTGKLSTDFTVADAYHWDQTWLGPNQIGRMGFPDHNGIAGNGYYFDAMGRVVAESFATTVSGGWQFGMAATYDLAGNPITLNYADGRQINQGFDAAGRLNSVTDADGTSYFSSAQYTPAGALASATLGNGVTEAFSFNNRLQPLRSTANSAVLPAITSGANLLDSQSIYSWSATNPCGSAPVNNNGNILSIVHYRNVGWTQSFCYDSLNRLITANRSDGGYNHTYTYDSFGNMTPPWTSNTTSGYAVDAVTNRLQRYTAYPGISDFQYDASGNMVSSGVPASGGHSYSYNALSDLYAVDGGNTASYQYYATDERSAKYTSAGWTQYVYFNGQPMAESTSDGTWTDYIYANGEKIAKVATQKPILHLHGTRDASNQGGGEEGALNGVSAEVVGDATHPAYTIQFGDRLSFDIMQTKPMYGGLALIFTTVVNGDGGSGDTTDAATGIPLYVDGTTGTTWQSLSGDLSAYAGRTISYVLVGTHNTAPTGTFDMYLANAAIQTADGRTLPILTGQPATVQNFTNTPIGDQMFTSAVEVTPVSATEGTNYYLDDHLGTTQMELASGGWPVWQGQFTPFGQEIDTQNTAMHYKFTGKERDAESGLDYFGARYYASSMGRWMSPDWSDKPEAVPYSSLDSPQSLNLYGYVNNNPLSRSDADGHFPVEQTLQAIDEFGPVVTSAIKLGFAAAGSFLSGVAAAAITSQPPGAMMLHSKCGWCDVQAQNAKESNQPAPNASSSGQTGSPTGPEGSGNKGMKDGSSGGPGSGKRPTEAQRKETLQENGGKCVVAGCNNPATHVDHADPKSRGGDTTQQNLQGMCAHHNCQKGAKTSQEYSQWLDKKQ